MEVDEYKYLGVYPSCLFEYYTGTHCMHFTLSLKHTSPNEAKELIDILNYCGANVSSDLKDAGGYTAVIADHNDKVNFCGPVFTLNYIKDCLELRKLQDISNYRQEKSKDIVVESNCMNIVYFRFCSWDSVISKPDDFVLRIDSTSGNRCPETSINTHTPDDVSSSSRIESTSENSSLETKINTHVSDDVSSSSSLRVESSSENMCPETNINTDVPDDVSSSVSLRVKSPYFPKERAVKQRADTTSENRKCTRMPYSYEEKCNILKYIIQHTEYSRIKGQKMWMVMERRKICPMRTWQSMKEHFLKAILPDLNSFSFLTETEKKIFMNVS